ncbi:MAG: hypothetical protein KatS3mg077_0587 [Candidatus Binatia bacterium]|nr:MAG: hypothetical protein KatS3mg077_0587 [Candidatus Binatia bacterium]
MPAHLWAIGTALIYGLAVLHARTAGAHVPWLRPVLLDLIRESECVVVGGVEATEADSRGRGVVLLRRPMSWCEMNFSEPLRIRTGTALPGGASFVFFLRRDAAGWRDVAPAGVVFPFDRHEQKRIHRALRQLSKGYIERRVALQRAALVGLLGAANLDWRYHAAVALYSLSQSSGGWTESERQRLDHYLRSEKDPAVQQLLRHISGGIPASAE